MKRGQRLSGLLAFCAVTAFLFGAGCDGDDGTGPGNGDDDTGPVSGSIDVTTSTTGATIDPDGYTVTVDGSESQAVGVNATVTFSDLSGGGHSVELSDVAVNCAVGGENPRTVPVAVGSTVPTTFDATCTATLFDQIAFVTDRDGNDDEIYVMNADGTGVINLTNSAGNDSEPDVSPDGTKLAFRTERDGADEIYVMNADGTGVMNLTNNAGEDFSPAWSLDGTKLAFVSDRDGNREIYVINVDGSNEVRLTNNLQDDYSPSWSPSGTSIEVTKP